MKKKIVHLSYSDIDGGAAKAALRIHQALSRLSSVESILLVDKKGTNVQKVYSPLSRFWRIYRRGTALFSKLILRNILLNSGTVNTGLFYSPWPKQLLKYNPDVVILHWMGREMFSFRQFSKLECNILIVAHDEWFINGLAHLSQSQDDCNLSYFRKLINTRLNSYLYCKKLKFIREKNIKFVVPSNYQKMIYSEKLPESNIIEIPHPINTGYWSNTNCSAEIKISDKVEGDRILLFGASRGSLLKSKGYSLIDSLLRELHLLNATKKFNLKINSFGDEDLIIDTPEGVEFVNLGFINDQEKLIDVYTKADIYFTLSSIESFGLTAQEAMTCETPVVAFKGSGLESVLIDFPENLINPGDLKSMARRIAEILQDSTNTTRYRKSMVQRFDELAIGEKYLNASD